MVRAVCALGMPLRKPSHKSTAKKIAKDVRMNAFCEQKREAEAQRNEEARQESYSGHV